MKSNDGAIAITFALAFLPIMGLAGAAIDYSKATAVRATIQQAADAAALAGARALSNGRPPLQARGQALWVFRANTAGIEYINNRGVPVIAQARDGFTMDVEATVAVPNNFLTIAGIRSITVAVKASATASDLSRQPMFVHLVVDNSQSMGLPETQAGRDLLQSRSGCNFACHSPHPTLPPPPGGLTTAQIATNNSIRLRIDTLRDALLEGLAYLKAERARTDVRVSFYSFAQTITDSFTARAVIDSVADRVRQMPMESMATMFYNLHEIARRIEIDVAGRSTDNLVVLATDGFNSRFAGAPADFFPILASSCNAFKDKGYKVAVLAVKYLDQGGFTHIISQLEPALRACASSPELFVQVNEAPEFAEGLNTLLQTAIGQRLTPPRITN
jgi:Flp pilus assembly protein TadG